MISFRKQYKSNVRFVLMNSFSTSADTLDYLQKYPILVADPNLELVQNKVRSPHHNNPAHSYDPPWQPASLLPPPWPCS